jgi:hypothetical protein
MGARLRGRRKLVSMAAVGAALLAVGCGNSSGGAPGGSSGGGQVSGTGGTTVAGSGPCEGAGCSAGGAANPSATSEAQACRDYFTAVCARIRECGAPKFRPCESPIDACPDMLFSEDSTWTLAQVVSCTAEWKTHSCDALLTDKGPACSQVPGSRPLGGECAFDTQCQTGRCIGGIVPSYQATCGTCGDVAPSHGACSATLVCPAGQSCEAGTCTDRPTPVEPKPAAQCYAIKCPDEQTCSAGKCVARRAVGETCSRETKCQAGLGCQIAPVSNTEDEQPEGICYPLPAIGQPCLPTFGVTGLCETGGTCTNRPTGNCVPLVEVGGACGFTHCVAGAYCNVLGYDNNLPTHICYERGKAGAFCDYDSSDRGAAACAEGFDCVCADATCSAGACTAVRRLGESCGDGQRCLTGLACLVGVCAEPADPNSPQGQLPPGMPCLRSTAFGRESSNCVEGLDCLCADAACTHALCALPRVLGESCDGQAQICRQGFTCTAGRCAELTTRDLEDASCNAPTP